MGKKCNGIAAVSASSFTMLFPHHALDGPGCATRTARNIFRCRSKGGENVCSQLVSGAVRLDSQHRIIRLGVELRFLESATRTITYQIDI